MVVKTWSWFHHLLPSSFHSVIACTITYTFFLLFTFLFFSSFIPVFLSFINNLFLSSLIYIHSLHLFLPSSLQTTFIWLTTNIVTTLFCLLGFSGDHILPLPAISWWPWHANEGDQAKWRSFQECYYLPKCTFLQVTLSMYRNSQVYQLAEL